MLFLEDSSVEKTGQFTKDLGGQNGIFNPRSFVNFLFDLILPKEMVVSHICWVVVSNIFVVHPYLGKISYLTHIFQMGWFKQQQVAAK